MSDYANFFRSASPYINAHRGKTFVIAISGAAINDGNLPNIIHDISLLNTLGINIVLVHGNRPQLNDRLQQCHIEPAFEQNRRVTDLQTLTCAKQAAGDVRFSLEAMFSLGQTNSGNQSSRLRIVSGNFITAKPLGVRDGIDFHHTGEIRNIDRIGIQQLLAQNAIALISPLGFSPTGEAFNLNYEEVASQVSISLSADKLIFLSDETGIQDTAGQLIQLMSLSELKLFIDNSDSGNQSPSTYTAAYDACVNGVDRCHLISYLNSDALIDELFSRDGVGTLILKEDHENIRAATIEDVAEIMELIKPLEEKGFLVKRSRELLEAEISRFSVMYHSEGILIACSALYPLNKDSAELACVAIHPDYQNQGVASRLLHKLEQQARQQGIEKLFTLTTRAAHWFMEKGFEETGRETLPAAKQTLYNEQRNSKVFVKRLHSNQ